jgi:phosphatidylglycerophosphate synthase
MRKISPKYENPLDNILIDFCALLSPTFKIFNMTPNMITTLSMITGVYSIKEYVNKNYLNSAILYGLSYLFDCLDGFYARKYKMVTKFGDYYDHIKDITVIGVLLYLIFIKYYNKKNILIPLILIILLFTCQLQISCQETLYDNKAESDILQVLNLFPIFSKKKTQRILTVSRYVGLGTMNLFIIFSILYSRIIDNK